MSHNVDVYEPTWLVLPTILNANQLASAPAGSIAISGATIVFHNGTAWKVLTTT